MVIEKCYTPLKTTDMIKMTKTIGLILGLIISIQLFGQSEGVSITTDNSAPDPSAMLDIKSINKGFLVPRLTTIQRNLIQSPAEGLEIYNLDKGNKEIWNGIQWTSAQTPIGTIQAFAGDTLKIPKGWILCRGQKLNKYDFPQYTDLYDVIGNYWGGSSGSDFKLPDFRGMFLRGAGTNGNKTMANGSNYSGGNLANYSLDQYQGHFHSINDPGHAHNVDNTSVPNAAGGRQWNLISGTPYTTTNTSSVNVTNITVTSSINDGTNGTPRVGLETNPTSYSINYIIKY